METEPTMFTVQTTLLPLVGGALIGLAATLMLALAGRIAGVSGIAARLLPPWGDRETAARAAFVLGLVAAPAAFAAFGAPADAPALPSETLLVVAAGLLVGFGSVWGNGCTSGHGVCGLSRLSPRSFVATATFMATAVATVALVRHVF
jgi:uncharacterized membrane protein YedE/YeeE